MICFFCGSLVVVVVVVAAVVVGVVGVVVVVVVFPESFIIHAQQFFSVFLKS